MTTLTATREPELDATKFSPSNIDANNINWFRKAEWDVLFASFIRIFQKNGNSWQMDKVEFDRILAVWEEEFAYKHGGVSQLIANPSDVKSIYANVLEIKGDKVQFKEQIQEMLLRDYKKLSISNSIKNIRKSFNSAMNKA
ncbi:MAG: hypothetical protein PHZ26_06080 [Candidatus Gracilibacteria bacterium]|nr:hypothetical protein [Candidatus Gracilibacteria bacterium]MDD2909282.1 hypothetical protein [Candidatus Gracilibacteria bacterium]